MKKSERDDIMDFLVIRNPLIAEDTGLILVQDDPTRYGAANPFYQNQGSHRAQFHKKRSHCNEISLHAVAEGVAPRRN